MDEHLALLVDGNVPRAVNRLLLRVMDGGEAVVALSPHTPLIATRVNPTERNMMELSILDSIQPHRQALVNLLIDCVHDGASIGFVPPLNNDEALMYWNGVMTAMSSGDRLLVVAFANGMLAGAVQLALCGKKNGLHRAEVEKLMVHTSHRRTGVGLALMERIEQLARDRGRTLLILDTRSDDTASALYAKQGFAEAGRIPGFALSANGRLEGTTYFFKSL